MDPKNSVINKLHCMYCNLFQNVGIGKLRPNILLMGFKSTWMTDDPIQIDRYFNVIQ